MSKTNEPQLPSAARVPVAPSHPGKARARRWARGLGLASGAALLLSLATVEQDAALALVAWLVSLALGLAAAGTALGAHQASPTTLARFWRWLSSREGLATAVLIVIGAALRLVDLAAYPSGLNGDEAEFALLALDVLQGTGPHPFGTAFLGDAALYSYALAPFLALFGPTVPGMRVFGALCGALTLPAFYLLAHRLFGPRAGLLALTLLAGSAVHVHFSRLTLNVPQVTLLFCLAAYALHRATQTRRPAWWYLAGLLGGIPVYFHFAGRLWPAVMALYFVYLLLVHRSQARAWLQGASVALLGGLAALAPLIVHLATRPDDFTDHLSGRLIFNLWPQVTTAHGTDCLPLILARQLALNLLGFISQPDGSNFFYTFAGLPLLFPVLAPVVFVAYLTFFTRGRDSRYGLLAAWFWTFILVGVVTNEPPQAHRLVNALPALLAVMAVILVEARDWLARRPRGVWVRGLSILLLCLPFLAGLGDNLNYFGPAAAARPWEEMTVYGQYAATLGEDQRLYSLGAPFIPFDHGNRRLLAPDVQGGDLTDATPSTLAGLPRDRELLFLAYRWNEDQLPALRAAFPEGREEVIRGPSGRVAFTLWRVPPR